MIKDILENLIKELQNEKNQENLHSALEPFSLRIKLSFYLVVFLLILIICNLIYSNVLISEIIKSIRR